MEAINSRIKKIRTQNGMTQEELSKALGSSRSQIASIESGYRSPSDLFVRSFCAYFAVRERWLRTGELPVRDTSAEAVSGEIAEAYFELAAELAPSIDTPELLTNMLKNCSEYSKIFHYISHRFLNLSDKNEPKRLAALFSVAFPDYLKVAETLLSAVSDQKKALLKSPPISRKVPLHPVGKAAAGTAIYDGEADEALVEIPLKFLNQELYFAIEVKGDSMSPKIPDNSYVIVQRSLLPQNGEIALVKLNDDFEGEYAVKKVHKVNGSIKLTSLNPAYPDKLVPLSQIISLEKVVYIIPPLP